MPANRPQSESEGCPAKVGWGELDDGAGELRVKRATAQAADEDRNIQLVH